MTRQEVIRTARLAAAATLLVAVAFAVARIGHPPPARIAARKIRPAISLHHGEARLEPGGADSPRISALSSAKGTHCSLTIPNGQLLQQNGGALWTRRANALTIDNRSGFAVVVKLRDMMLGHMRASVFVAKNSTAIYDRVPDGRYVIDYALGNALDETCSTFSHLVYAGQLGLLRFAAQDAGRETVYDRQEITIPPLADQDADTNAIGKDAFDFD